MIDMEIEGREIEAHETKWGIRWDDGDVSLIDNEQEARELANSVTAPGGFAEVVAREVYVTAWASAL